MPVNLIINNTPSTTTTFENILTLSFYLVSLFVLPNKFFLLILVIYISGLYLISKDLVKTLWLGFLASCLTGRTITLSLETVAPAHTLFSTNFPASLATYFLAFSDLVLALLIYLLVKIPAKAIRLSQRLINIIICMLGILVLGLFSTYSSLDFSPSLFNLFILGKYFLIYFVALIVHDHDRSIFKQTIITILLFIMLNSCLVIGQKYYNGSLGLPAESINMGSPKGVYADENLSVYRPSGLFNTPNLIGTLIAMSIPLFLTLNLSSLWVQTALLITGIALLLTSSRIAILSLIILLPFIVHKFKSTLQIFAAHRWIRFALIIGLAFSLPSVITRLLSFQSALESNGGASYRIRHFSFAVQSANQHIFGSGVNTFQYAISRSATNLKEDFGSPAHNVFAEIIYDFGFLGIPLFSYLFYLLMKPPSPYSSPSPPVTFALFFAMLCYTINIQAHPWFLEKPAADIFWILSGVFYASQKTV